VPASAQLHRDSAVALAFGAPAARIQPSTPACMRIYLRRCFPPATHLYQQYVYTLIPVSHGPFNTVALTARHQHCMQCRETAPLCAAAPVRRSLPLVPHHFCRAPRWTGSTIPSRHRLDVRSPGCRRYVNLPAVVTSPVRCAIRSPLQRARYIGYAGTSICSSTCQCNSMPPSLGCGNLPFFCYISLATATQNRTSVPLPRAYRRLLCQ